MTAASTSSSPASAPGLPWRPVQRLQARKTSAAGGAQHVPAKRLGGRSCRSRASPAPRAHRRAGPRRPPPADQYHSITSPRSVEKMDRLSKGGWSRRRRSGTDGGQMKQSRRQRDHGRNGDKGSSSSGGNRQPQPRPATAIGSSDRKNRTNKPRNVPGRGRCEQQGRQEVAGTEADEDIRVHDRRAVPRARSC